MSDRRCVKCGRRQPADQFRPMPSGRLRTTCKTCVRQYQRAWYARRPHKHLSVDVDPDTYGQLAHIAKTRGTSLARLLKESLGLLVERERLREEIRWRMRDERGVQ